MEKIAGGNKGGVGTERIGGGVGERKEEKGVRGILFSYHSRGKG